MTNSELVHIWYDLEVRKVKVFEGGTPVTVCCYQLICINLHIKNILIIRW